jgi:predicted glycoside hydrolase/deacetylase ChbG (UPF0249 family)
MKQLIVAADDFGLTKSVNEGIVRAHQEGIVTSLNLLPTGEAFDDALRLAKDIGLDEAGAHLALTETRAITDPAKILTLVDTDGNFYKGHAQFFLKFISGGIDLGQIYVEWRAQLEKARAVGITITNLSTHEHIHMIPALLDIVIRLAKEYNIPAVRYPHADRSFRPLTVKTLYKQAALICLEKKTGKMLRSSGLVYPDHFLGFLDSGNITETVLLSILDSLDEGTTELVCHPGFLGPEVLTKYTFHTNCEAELFALTHRRVKKHADEKCIGLIGYAEFIQNYKDR